MKILLIGASGTLGKRLNAALSPDHEVITAGRSSGDYHVDIRSEDSIRNMFGQCPQPEALICAAASGDMDNFATLTQDALLDNMRGKLLGQISLVLVGQHFLPPGGSFTLTSGVFADEPHIGVTGGGVISGALHSFVYAAALELSPRMRVNAVSPGMLQDSAPQYGALFPGLPAISMDAVVHAYRQTLFTDINGQVLRLYR
ncbi:short chain dehydrogenase [Pedobacter sp. SYP-B3415]|uniref:short chain dehydrogenase n=1 Tax=Pedobacter sp. SYP-B3415 TaxID=2496641 RepID=UPI0013EDE134|nr:short chain dehydrogenase [Pedobacter sp. SYP-B3415]